MKKEKKKKTAKRHNRHFSGSYFSTESLLISFKMLSKVALPRAAYIPTSQAPGTGMASLLKTPSQLPHFFTGSIVGAWKGAVTWPRLQSHPWDS